MNFIELTPVYWYYRIPHSITDIEWVTSPKQLFSLLRISAIAACNNKDSPAEYQKRTTLNFEDGGHVIVKESYEEIIQMLNKNNCYVIRKESASGV